MRSDHKANQERLIDAAARLFEHRQDVRLADIAKEAGLSVATAYRHFDSVDDVVDAYRLAILDELDAFIDAHEAGGPALLADASARWVDLVLERGAALVQCRSTDGFLDRALHGSVGPARQVSAMERPLRTLIVQLDLQDIPDIQIESSFLWNILFDPREIFDLHRTRGLSAAKISRRLGAAFRGALLGWAAGGAVRNA